jgi:uncharacterized protein YcbX
VPVSQLWRYPVKGLGGESLQTVRVLLRGLEGDRCHGLLGPTSRPVSARAAPGLVRFAARFRPDQPPLVETPVGRRLPWGSPPLQRALADVAGPFRPYTVPAGAYDAWPVLLVGTGSLQALGDALGAPVDARRVRPNVVCELPEPFAEDDWIGRVVVVGDAIVRVLERCAGCTALGIDPDSGEDDPALPDIVRHQRDGCLGVYCEVLTPGRVSVGSGVNAG